MNLTQTNISRGFGWRIHCSVEVTELSTNKQHTLSVLVAVTHVARHLVLRARVPPLGRIHQAAPVALVALSLPRLLL